MAGKSVFPFPARRRIVGARLGQAESVRRGQSADVAGSRGYEPGDDMRMIDWAASARLSALKGRDEFVVREFFAEETPVAAIVIDGSWSLQARAPAPLLDKQQALRAAASLIADSAKAARSSFGLLELNASGARWLSPSTRGAAQLLEQRLAIAPAPDAPFEATPAQLVSALAQHPAEVPQGSLVFILSDFFRGGFSDSWPLLEQMQWEIVPVVLQDARFEQSFPLEAAGLVLPFQDGPAYVSASTARRLKEEHERRLSELKLECAAHGVAVVVGSSGRRDQLLPAFCDWSRQLNPRRRARC